MEQPPPPPLDYRRPREPRKSTNAPFFTALLIGTIVSAIAWSILWFSPDASNSNLAVLVLAIPALKLVIAIICMFKADWRLVGGGLLASIGIGFLIFFGLCAANLSGLKI